MKKSITKQGIINALKNEPRLKVGRWFHDNNDYTYKKDCAVCAVGCVLRAMSFEKWAQEKGLDLITLGNRGVHYEPTGGDSYFQLTKYLSDKNYLAALSCFFERGKTRKQCIAFVKKHFPRKLTITIA